MRKSPIHFMEKNIYGAWVVYGLMDIKQYYYYTKAQARQMYVDEYNKTYFEVERRNKV